jgi:alkylated DNA repair dioxygenase AlkB
LAASRSKSYLIAIMARRPTAIAQHDLFAPEPAWPAGFAYQADLIAAANEAALLGDLEALSFQPFDFHGFLAKRHVAWFGWRYDYAGGQLRDSEPIPPFLFPLRASAAAFAGVEPERLQQVLINRYAPGAGIGWHRDKPMFGDVIAVSLAARYACAAETGTVGNAPRSTCNRARLTFCAAKRAGTGSTAFRRSTRCGTQ